MQIKIKFPEWNIIRQIIPYTLSALIGIGVWTAHVIIDGYQGPFDSYWYISIGFPIMLIGNYIIGIIEPKHPWRWGLVSFLY